MLRRTFLCALPAFFLPSGAKAHSPWGQYAVYRQKHLLVLSTRDDADSYGYSRLLVDVINISAPEASARPARAINLERAYNLLRTDQFQFVLLSTANIEAMRTATGAFAGKPPVDLKTIYQFDQLEFAVVAHFPDELVAVVTDAVLSYITALPGALPPELVLKQKTLHQGARDAIENF